MYLLIPKRRKRAPLGLTYLHPTMYLLIPIPQLPNLVLSNTFTSHYVSINSSANTAAGAANTDLHPTMYLLIRSRKRQT